MQSSSPSPDDPGAKRRSPFRRGSPSDPDGRIEEVLAEYQRELEQRLDRGLQAIQASAVKLMKDIAAEMWRTSGGDAAAVQPRILEFLSRDQAIRGLIAHSDERFQALAVRTERLEDALRQVTRTNAALAEHIGRSAKALGDVAQSPAMQNVGALREQLEQVERHLSSTVDYIAERDQELVAKIAAQVEENATLVGRETGRIVEAMQNYVTDGVDTMGRLAQRMERHVESAEERDDELTDRIHAQIQTTLGEQIQLLYERLGIEARTLADALSAHEAWMTRALEDAADRADERAREHVETTREAVRLAANDVNRLLEARVIGLAQLVRSDSEALRQRLVETATAQDEAVGRMLDDRLIRVTEAVEAATALTVDETTRRIGETTERAIDGRVEEITLLLDRNLVVLKEKLDEDLRGVGERTAEVVGTAMDQRIVGLARMIRSDNERLAARLEALAAAGEDQETAKQTLRAVKELEATLGNELLNAMDRKFSVLADQLHR
jgi:DNA-binding ferritin-like protein